MKYSSSSLTRPCWSWAPGMAMAMALAVTPVQAADDHPAQAVVRDVTQTLVASRDLLASGVPDGRWCAAWRAGVDPHIDFDRMTRQVLAASWTDTALPDRERTAAILRRHLMNTYVSVLNGGAEIGVAYLKTQVREGQGRVTVRTKVDTAAGYPMSINFAMYAQGEAWRMYDVIADGVGLVGLYRAVFAAEGRDRGLAALLDRMEGAGSAGRGPAQGCAAQAQLLSLTFASGFSPPVRQPRAALPMGRRPFG